MASYPLPVRARRVLGLALLCMASHAVGAQVEWFTKERPGESGYLFSSHVGTSAKVGGAELTPRGGNQCTFGAVNAPKVRAGWWAQFSDPPCTSADSQLAPGKASTFRALDRAQAKGWNSARQEGRLDTTAAQQVTFDESGMRLAAEVTSTRSGAPGVVTRGLPAAWGEVYLRVEADQWVDMAVRARLKWSGRATVRSGFLQITWMPNTLTDPGSTRAHFGLNAAEVKPGASELEFTRRVVLGPGVYSITWAVRDDTPGVDSSARLDLVMQLGPAEPEVCPEPAQSRAPGWPRGTQYSARIEPIGEPGPAEPVVECLEGSGQRCIYWMQTPVHFKIVKNGRSLGDYVGWKYKPGTLRRDWAHVLKCNELDPRFNCHGLTFAAGNFWLDEKATRAIRSDWCPTALKGADLRGGVVRVFRESRFQIEMPTLAGAGGRYVLKFREPSHSQTLQRVLGEVDQKLGIVKYGYLPKTIRLTNESWADDLQTHYLCDF